MSVNEMWVNFKTGLVEAVKRFNPSKMTKTKYFVPWIDVTIKRLVKKRHKGYLCARKSKDADVKNHYRGFRAHVQKVLRYAYWKYVSKIFAFENDSPDPDTPKPEKINKKRYDSELPYQRPDLIEVMEIETDLTTSTNVHTTMELNFMMNPFFDNNFLATDANSFFLSKIDKD